MNAPPLGNGYDWQTKEALIAISSWRGWQSTGSIYAGALWPSMSGHTDLQQHSGAWRGALYGQSSNSKLAAFLRPHNRAKDVRGLYFAGGTTHPGGGVPMVTLSGKVAAEMMLED
ncbi:MAG: hypothetical protein R3E31_05570 [Chloroflexota bacterium]